MRSVTEKARTLMFTAGAPSYLWDRAICHATLLHNLVPNTADKRSPFERINGFKPNLSLLRTWSCTVHAHIPKEKRKGKFDKATTRCVHVGMKENSNVYQLWNPKTKQLFYSSDIVMFDEADFSAICENSNTVPNGLNYHLPSNTTGVEKSMISPNSLARNSC